MITLARRIVVLLVVITVLGIAVPAVPHIGNVPLLADAWNRARGVLDRASSDDVRVLRVIDGDTFVARIAGERVRVRIIGVDTPESVKPGTPARCYGKVASNASTRQLTGQDVRLEYGVDKTDKYGRTLAYVRLRGRDYGAWLVRQGFARALEIPPNIRNASQYARLQRAAKHSGRGLWGHCANAFSGR